MTKPGLNVRPHRCHRSCAATFSAHRPDRTRMQRLAGTPRIGVGALGKQEELCPGKATGGLTWPCSHFWQHTAHPTCSCAPELALCPKSFHDFLGAHVCAWAFTTIPGPGSGSRNVFRPQVPVQPKALPWAAMVSIDTDVDSACPSSG